MRKLLLTVFSSVVFLYAVGQSTDTRSLSSFDEVSVQEGIEVILKKGDDESARIEARGVDADEVLTEVSGGRLKIHLEGSNHRNVDVTVYVTYKELSGLRASSAGSIRVDGAVEAGGDFEIGASSAGSVKLKLAARFVEIDVSSSGDVEIDLKANELEAGMSSAGEIKATGSVKYAEIDGSSSGEFDGYDFVCDKAELEVSSGASIKLTVNESLDGRASSGGSVRYKGSPSRVNASSSSGGSVKKY